MLPDLSSIDPGLLVRLRALGVTPELVRRLTEGPDTLLSPLAPSRECTYSDDAAAIAVRDVFCSAGFHVRFVHDLLIVSDYLGNDPAAVMGAGETTAVLYRAAKPTGRVRRVLDLGCGAGTLGLLLARDADAVVATDINPRAVDLARCNADTNGIRNIELRLGDLFDPVSGEKFDLIVSQPPYYPGTGDVFLHGGERGNELTERLLAEIPTYLTADGIAIVHTSWPEDQAFPAITGARIVEYTPALGEVPGARHSLIVLEHGAGVERIDVPAERWGQLTSLNRPSRST